MVRREGENVFNGYGPPEIFFSNLAEGSGKLKAMKGNEYVSVSTKNEIE